MAIWGLCLLKIMTSGKPGEYATLILYTGKVLSTVENVTSVTTKYLDLSSGVEYIYHHPQEKLLWDSELASIGIMFGYFVGTSGDISDQPYIMQQAILGSLLIYIFGHILIFMGQDVSSVTVIILNFVQGLYITNGYALLAHWSAPYVTLCFSIFMYYEWSSPEKLTRHWVFWSEAITLGPIKNFMHTKISVALITLLWLAMWRISIYKRPHYHPFMSEKARVKLLVRSEMPIKDVEFIPFRKIYVNKQFCIYLFSIVSFEFLKYNGKTVLAAGFKYMSKDYITTTKMIQDYLVICSVILSSFIADLVIRYQVIDKTLQRKIWGLIYINGSTVLIGLMSELYINCHNNMSKDPDYVYLLYLFKIVNGIYYSSLSAYPYDLSPTFVAAQIGFAHGFVNGFRIFQDVCIQELVEMQIYEDCKNVAVWAMALTGILGSLMVYVRLARHEIQPFNVCSVEMCPSFTTHNQYPVILNYKVLQRNSANAEISENTDIRP